MNLVDKVTVVILAAGYGTRMRSGRAKVLHEVGGATLLNQVIRAALHIAAPERIIVVVGHQAERVRASVTVPGIRFANQEQQLGTGHAVLCARPLAHAVSGALLILNGDGPLLRPGTLSGLIEFSRTTPSRSAIVTTRLHDPTGYGRIIDDQHGLVSAIVEQKVATPDQLAICEINPGVYCFESNAFWEHVGELNQNNSVHEFYLTDMVEILHRHGLTVAAYPVRDSTELLGINTRVELAVADKILRLRKAEELMLAGVTIENPESVTIDADVQIGPDTIIEANVQLRGVCVIGSNCQVGTGTILRNCSVEDDVRFQPYVVAEDSCFRSRSTIGPFSRLRMGAVAEESSHIGNFVEIKKSRLGQGSKAGHLAYLGDSEIGKNVNIGAGTITCNYDGEQKHQTVIADEVFVGSNSTLVAPISIEEGSYVAAGSTITRRVQAHSLAIGRAYQVEKPGWAKKRRNKKND